MHYPSWASLSIEHMYTTTVATYPHPQAITMTLLDVSPGPTSFRSSSGAVSASDLNNSAAVVSGQASDARDNFDLDAAHEVYASTHTSTAA